MSGFLKVVLQGLLLKVMREKIKQGSLHAVRFYVSLVQQARLASMAVLAVTAIAALVVVGFAFIVGSVIFLLPILREAVPYVFLGVGCAMVLVGALALRFVFKEERWMEMSKAYALIDGVTQMGAESADDTQGLFTQLAGHAEETLRPESKARPMPPPSGEYGQSARTQSTLH